MKKLALAGLFSILATISLSGCNQAPVEEETQADDTTQIVQEKETDFPAPKEGELNNYNNEALEFDHPATWIMSDESTRNNVKWAYIGDEELNEDISVEFRSPIVETAYMGWTQKEVKDLSKDGLKIKMQILEEDKEFAAEQGLEDDGIEEMASLTVIEDPSNLHSYQFFLTAPAKDFEKYNAFVETAVDTFKVYTEGGGGVAADESADNYPKAPATE